MAAPTPQSQGLNPGRPGNSKAVFGRLGTCRRPVSRSPGAFERPVQDLMCFLQVPLLPQARGSSPSPS